MKCPNCKDATLVMSERKGIEIDYCPDCRGVWLDRGELDKIIEKSVEAQPAERVETGSKDPAYNPGPQYNPNQHNQNAQNNYGHQQQSGQYYQKPYKRKKSFIEELFD